MQPKPKICQKCGRPLSRGQCKDCRKLYDGGYYQANQPAKVQSATQRKRELQEWYQSLKTGKACRDCGAANLPTCCYDFDHLPEYVKKFDISWGVRNGLSKSKIQEELNKCVLICANCHRVRTFRRAKGEVV